MRHLALLLALGLPACATIPEPTGGDEGLPNAGAGPFRALVVGEVGNQRVAPNVLNDSRGYARDVAVIDLDGEPDTYDVAGFVGAAVKQDGVDPKRDTPTSTIVRYGAIDGRSFDRSAVTVLTADAAWEGGVMGAPAVVRVGSELRLYYAAAGGIGLARGDAMGMTFTKEPAPVLGPASGGWEGGAAPESPGVVQLADGSFRLFYAIALPGGGSAIGEARSDDGTSFERIGDEPALEGAKGSADADAGDPPYDGGGVGAPSPILAKASDGEVILRVYYGAVDASGKRTIGLAARYGTDGALQRAVSPVFGTGKELQPTEPCVVTFGDFSLIFVTEMSTSTNKDPVIAAGLAPATAALPPPSPM